MRKVQAIILAGAMALAALAFSTPAQAEINAPQTLNYGLQGEGVSNFVGRFDALGWATLQLGNHIYVGGKFLEISNGVTTHQQANLARFNLDGSFDASWRPSVAKPVLDLDVHPDGDLIIAGEVRNVQGVDTSSIAKINPNTLQLDQPNIGRVYGGTNAVSEIEVASDGWIYAVGSFKNQVGGGGVTNAVRFDHNGDMDTNWVPSLTGGAAWDVAVHSSGEVFLAGWFTHSNGLATQGLISVDGVTGTTNVWTGFVMNYPCCNNMYGVDILNDTVIGVGEQHASYTYDYANGMALIASQVTSYDSRYQDSSVRRGGDAQHVRIEADGRAYIGAHAWGSTCEALDGTAPAYNSNLANTNCTHAGTISGIMAVDAVTGVRDQGFNPYMAGDLGGTDSELASDGCLWITGGFNAVGTPGNQKAGRDLVRLCDNDGPVGPPVTPPPPACTFSRDGINVDVQWTTVAGFPNYIVRRTVDGGTAYWRGAVTGSSMLDTDRSGVLAYTVETKVGSGNSTRTACTDISPEPELQVPIDACRTFTRGGLISIQWTGAANADKFVIRRSVDGGTHHWRGAVDAPGTNFIDTTRNGSLEYFVQSKYGNVVQAKVACTNV